MLKNDGREYFRGIKLDEVERRLALCLVEVRRGKGSEGLITGIAKARGQYQAVEGFGRKGIRRGSQGFEG